MESVFTVYINGAPEKFDNFESAARYWDSKTHSGGHNTGGIAIQQFQNGLMVRDGWLIHVHENGFVFINPGGITP